MVVNGINMTLNQLRHSTFNNTKQLVEIIGLFHGIITMPPTGTDLRADRDYRLPNLLTSTKHI